MIFAKIRDVKSPQRGTSLSAGIDFFIPNYSENFLKDFLEKNTCPNDKKGFTIKPHERVLIPSGIKVSIPKDCALLVNNKSGVSSKKGLSFMANVIDADYEGEVHISLVNTSNDPCKVLWGEKITQMILVPVKYNEPLEYSIEQLQKVYEKNSSERGAGGFGSTGD